MIYIPNIIAKNYINIRYHKMNGRDLWTGMNIVENYEPMVFFSTLFDIRFHCELQDSIIRFPFDEHSCNLEVNCSHKEG